MPRMGTFILLSAIPGSGKSTWAREYQRVHPNTYIVASDEVRCRVSGAIQNFEHEDLVWATFLKEINDHAGEDCTVIADATNLQNRFRHYYREATPGFDHHVLVVFKIPFEICMKQNKMRDHSRVVCDEAMYKLRDEYEEVGSDIIDLYDEYIVVDENYDEEHIK